MAKKSTVKNYFNVSQLRTDTWNDLKYNALQYGKVKEGKITLAEINKNIETNFKTLKVLEPYWSFPGKGFLQTLIDKYNREEYKALGNAVSDTLRMIVSEEYRGDSRSTFNALKTVRKEAKEEVEDNKQEQNYFETLLIDNITPKEEADVIDKFKKLRSTEEKCIYDVLVAKTFQDALIALLFNYNIQACVIRYGVPYASKNAKSFIKSFITSVHYPEYKDYTESQLGLVLGKLIKQFRPELDVYYFTDTSVEVLDDDSFDYFNRIFYRKENLQELHLSILRGVNERYTTPFFSALVEYSKKPMSVFHAMPISRGNSVYKSRWITDFGEFYGRNLFLAETSSTTGGLDSLLQPTGPLKKAQQYAAKAFGAKQTYFVTNGTSTANKIVVQALVQQGDLVLIDRDCHKSHHYGMVLAGAYPVYLDSYPVEEYSMYGAVPLQTIKKKMLELKKAGRLHKVKMLLLTNCTFDGIVHNVERVIEEVLAIKPDMIFLWDEAWFAFASFTHMYKQRTAMYVADKLYKKYNSPTYRATYNRHIKSIKAKDKNAVPTLPNPDEVKIRVYSTHSTHKTLSAIRQGSMIHIYDEEFKRKAIDSFHEAYMTHISTSPNYQILASLDISRRQAQFEGYELVEKSIEMAMMLRAKINSHPKLKKYFDVLTVKNFIPKQYRETGIHEYYDNENGWVRMEEAWATDEFVLDPTKINLFIGKTGLDGDTFKNEYLMDQHGIQINKTSRNTVLFMTNIGTTRSSVAYLISSLLKISKQLDERFKSFSTEELKQENARIHSLTTDVPPLPDFSSFHSSFQAVPGVSGGNIREAFFLSYDESKVEYIALEDCEEAINNKRQLVSTSFIIPYPPGFPILVPGQVVSKEILEFLIKLDVDEIHGYRPDLGLKVFTEAALNRQKTGTAMGGLAQMQKALKG
jgi:arginine decarboxylase